MTDIHSPEDDRDYLAEFADTAPKELTVNDALGQIVVAADRHKAKLIKFTIYSPDETAHVSCEICQESGHMITYTGEGVTIGEALKRMLEPLLFELPDV